MNRNYYCKVNSQKEADKLLKKLRDVGEDTDRYHYTDRWQYIVYDKNALWALSNIKTFKEEFEGKIEVPASELIDYVTGKKLDKDALLEEAKKRYPIGTKFKSVNDKEIYKVETNSHRWYGGGIDVEKAPWVYLKGNWAEIVEEPKVETKEEFVLPENWHVVVTKDNQQVLSDWRGTKVPIGYIVGIDSWNGKKNSKGHNPKNSIKGDTFNFGIEITFDQFKKYILKQEVKEEIKSMGEWSVGSYVVFLKDYGGHPKGTIDTIRSTTSKYITVENCLFNGGSFTCNLYKNSECKWFPTLQEAQKFSDELLGKNKTGSKVKDLVEGEIYYCESCTIEFKQWLYKYLTHNSNPTSSTHAIRIDSGNYYDNNSSTICGVDYVKNIRIATPAEKKWLKTCIKQDKFISKEDLDKYDDGGNLMESEEYPEYVELLKGWSVDGEFVGEIFGTSKDFQQQFKKFREITRTWDWNYILTTDYHKKYFKPSTKSAYDAQFKKDEDYKVGDWVVIEDSCKLENGCIGCPEGIFKIIKDTKEHIHGLVRSNNTYLIQTSNAVWRISNQGVRKALPWEIPVENSVKQYPYTPEESIKLDFKVQWKEPRYIGGVDSITATGWGIYEQMKKQPIQSRKTPDLIDKTKVEVKIKRTKVKQIKL